MATEALCLASIAAVGGEAEMEGVVLKDLKEPDQREGWRGRREGGEGRERERGRGGGEVMKLDGKGLTLTLHISLSGAQVARETSCVLHKEASGVAATVLLVQPMAAK